MYNDRVNLPFGISTEITGNYTKVGADTTLIPFSQKLNMTVNVNMPFSIFFDIDLPDDLSIVEEKVYI